MYYRADNDSSIASSDIYSILQSSVSEWNSHGDISVGLYPSSVNNQYDGRNDIYFSDSSTFFSGGGVVGVTQLVYRSGTGEILEADIILNDNYSFSTNTSDRYYLGNVVTHELGHVLGLGHSEVHNSTMFYQLSKNQHNIKQDDKSAVTVLYPTAVSLGSISGKIVGGERLLGVFAAHVQAISRSSGLVAASALSDEDGTFVIGGLPLNDEYYIYVGPSKYLAAQTSYYQTARTNFCSGGGEYRGSFFESCHEDEMGHPNAVTLDSSNIAQNLGMITIKCDLSIPDEMRTDSEMNIIIDNSHTGGAIVDYFATAGGAAHRITYDLTGYAIPSDLYFDLKLITQTIYSTGDYKVNIYLNKSYSDVLDTPDVTYDNSGATSDLSINGSFEVTASIFTVEVIAESALPAGNFGDFFSDAYSFADDYNFYLLSYGLKTFSAGQYYPIPISGHNGGDNAYCPKAQNTYTVVSNSTDYVPQQLISKEEMVPGTSCGSIDIDEGPGGSGPMSLALGFFMIFLLFSPKIIFQRQD